MRSIHGANRHVPGTSALPVREASPERALGTQAVGFTGRIHAVRVDDGSRGTLPATEVERRLLELGFTEGALVEILHQGLFRDPIAVRVAGTTVALRRSEACAVLVAPL